MRMIKKLEPIHQQTFILDVFRGLAAIYVLIGHARWLLWEGYSDGFVFHTDMYGWFDSCMVYFLLIFKFGHYAVLLFFVLSGFVIHFSTYKSWLRSTSFSIPQYIYKRFKRIYPPFVFAILLTFLLDSIGKSLSYSIYNSSSAFYVESDLSAQTFFGNLTMLQTVYTKVWGTNYPVWSLMYEWWFYLLYIPIFYLNKIKPFFTTVLVCIVCAFNISFDIGLPILCVKIFNYFLAWYVGLVLADIYLKRYSVKVLYGSIATICSTVGYLLIFQTQNITKDLALSVAMALLIYVSLTYSNKIDFLKKLRILGDSSYTLYVIHYPILTLLAGFVMHTHNGNRSAGFAYMTLGIGVCLVLAWFVHLIVEKPFINKIN